MLGVLTGDCLGSPYENEKFSSGTKLVLQNSFDKLEGPIYKGIYLLNLIDSKYFSYDLLVFHSSCHAIH